MKFSSTVMKLSNLLRKAPPEPAESGAGKGAEKKTKTIDLPPLQDKPKVDFERLAKILEEDEKKQSKYLEELKMQVNSGTYVADSKEVATSVIEFLELPKKDES